MRYHGHDVVRGEFLSCSSNQSLSRHETHDDVILMTLGENDLRPDHSPIAAIRAKLIPCALRHRPPHSWSYSWPPPRSAYSVFLDVFADALGFRDL